MEHSVLLNTYWLFTEKMVKRTRLNIAYTRTSSVLCLICM